MKFAKIRVDLMQGERAVCEYDVDKLTDFVQEWADTVGLRAVITSTNIGDLPDHHQLQFVDDEEHTLS